MKKLRIVKIIVVIFVFLIICIVVYNNANRKQENENYKNTYIWDLAQKINSDDIKVKKVDDLGIYTMLDLVLCEKDLWDKLALSDNFKQKYNSPKSIIKDIDKYKNISIGIAPMHSENNVIIVSGTARKSIVTLLSNKNVDTEYVFEYILNDNNQLDDLKLLKKVDIDSMTAETYDIREYE